MKLFIDVGHVSHIILKGESCFYFPLYCKHSKNVYINVVILVLTIKEIPWTRLGIRNPNLCVCHHMYSEEQRGKQILLTFLCCAKQAFKIVT